MTFVSVFLLVGAVALGLMLLLWVVSLAVRNSSIVDIFWGTGFVILTWTVGPAALAARPAPELGEARGFPLRPLAGE
jgi:steroid 5-alpha reductase family enzyme